MGCIFYQYSSIYLYLSDGFRSPIERMLFDLTLETVMSRRIRLVDFAATIHVRTNLRLVCSSDDVKPCVFMGRVKHTHVKLTGNVISTNFGFTFRDLKR